jgi:hypothetical protein
MSPLTILGTSLALVGALAVARRHDFVFLMNLSWNEAEWGPRELVSAMANLGAGLEEAARLCAAFERGWKSASAKSADPWRPGCRRKMPGWT